MIREISEHRSIRKFKRTPVAQEVIQEIMEAGTRASTVGNMQLYTMVVTTSKWLREELAPCHFNQPMVTQAPVVITVCADIHRFSKWCKMRDAEPVYDNFVWFINATIDALLASENIALQAEAHGLGICYLGTTLYTADKIAKILELPNGVIPITTIVMGYPDQQPPLTDRLPLCAVVHYDKYHDYTPEQINDIWAEREASQETSELLKENELPNLAQIFTQRRYTAKDNLEFSKSYFEILKQQGFFNQ